MRSTRQTYIMTNWFHRYREANSIQNKNHRADGRRTSIGGTKEKNPFVTQPYRAPDLEKKNPKKTHDNPFRSLSLSLSLSPTNLIASNWHLSRWLYQQLAPLACSSKRTWREEERETLFTCVRMEEIKSSLGEGQSREQGK